MDTNNLKIEKLNKWLKNADKNIDRIKLNANRERGTGNDLRAAYLDGTANELSKVYRDIRAILESEA